MPQSLSRWDPLRRGRFSDVCSNLRSRVPDPGFPAPWNVSPKRNAIKYHIKKEEGAADTTDGGQFRCKRRTLLFVAMLGMKLQRSYSAGESSCPLILHRGTGPGGRISLLCYVWDPVPSSVLALLLLAASAEYAGTEPAVQRVRSLGCSLC